MNSIDEEGTLFLNGLERRCKEEAEKKGEKFEVVTRVIPFLNDDVPNYLRKLAYLEEESRKSKIEVGYCNAA